MPPPLSCSCIRTLFLVRGYYLTGHVTDVSKVVARPTRAPSIADMRKELPTKYKGGSSFCLAKAAPESPKDAELGRTANSIAFCARRWALMYYQSQSGKS